MQKFRARITAIGELAKEFIEEGILVFFADTAPEELHEHAVVHDDAETLSVDVIPGDVVRIGDAALPVLAVGAVANENFRNLGHLVLKFNGLREPEMEGDVNVPETAVPAMKVGMEVAVVDSVE